MTARSVLTVVGQAIGGAYGGAFGAAIGGAIGGTIGGFIDGPVRNEQALIDDLSALKFDYGSAWPRIYGRYRVKVMPMWSSSKRPVQHVEEVDEKGGPGAENVTYTYVQDWLCWAPLGAKGWLRIWINGELKGTRHVESPDSALHATAQTTSWQSVTFFDGAADQMPWAVYEAAVGTENAVAFRHRPTLAFESLELPGANPPLVEVEFMTSSDESGTTQLLLSAPLSDDVDDVITNPGGTVVDVDGTVYQEDEWTILEMVPGDDARLYYVKDSMHDVINAALGLPVTVSVTIEPLLTFGEGTADASVLFFAGVLPRVAQFVTRMVSGQIQLVVLAYLDPGLYERNLGPMPSGEHEYRIVFSGDGLEVTFFIDGIEVARSSFGLRTPTRVAIQLDDVVSAGLSRIRVRDLRVYLGAGVDFEVADPQTVPLLDIVRSEALLEWSGEAGALTEDDLDLAELEGIEVTGFLTTGSPRESIAQAMDAYYFGITCSDKLYARLRGAPTVAAIPFSETGMGVGEPGEPFTGVERGGDIEVPIQVVVTGPNILADYEPGAEPSDRLVGESVELRRYTTAFVFTPAERKGRAATMVQDGRIAAHEAVVTVDDRHVGLEVNDVWLQADDEGSVYRVRAGRETYADGIHSFEVVLDDAAVLASSGITAETDRREFDVVLVPDTVAVPLDIPLLRDADDGRGIYAAAKPDGESKGWGGWGYYQSADDASFTGLARGTRAAVIGTCSTVPDPFEGGHVIDEAGVFVVDVGDGVLTSSTHDAVMADETVNAFAVGAHGRWMLGQFRKATLQAPGVYELRGILHGCRGTEHAIGTQQVGDTFVLLRTTGGVLRVPQQPGDRDVQRYWRAVSAGRPVDSATSGTITQHEVGLMPYALVDLRVARTAGGIQVSGDRRSRYVMNWLTGVVPLGEESEAYEMDVISGTTVLRTLAAPLPNFLYTPAQQAADGVTEATTVTLRMYQLSAKVGRGYPASITTTGGYSSVAGEVAVTVGGTFAAGRLLHVIVNGVMAQHLTVSGDTNLAGAATALAAAVDALAGVSASAAGAVVTIEADAGGPLSVLAGVTEPSKLSDPYTLQIASGVSAGAPEVWHVSLAAVDGALLSPGRYRIRILRSASGAAVDINADYQTSTPLGSSSVLSGLVDAINGGDANSLFGITAANYGSYVRVQFRTGEAGWAAMGSTVTQDTPVSHYWGGERAQAASPVVPAPQPQVTYVGVAGTVTSGDTYHVTVNGTTINKTAVGGDTAATIAASLTSSIDALPAVSAADVTGTTPAGLSTYPGLVRITGDANAVPFTISTSTDATMTLTVSVVTEGA